MTVTVHGRVGWNFSQDKEGQRTYKLRTLVETSTNTGPGQIALAAGMPAIGATWAYGGDTDLWAFCTPEMSASPLWDGPGQGPCDFWIIEQTFQTFSPNDRKRKRCQDDRVEDPLSEPPRIGGSFVRAQKKAEKDRNGDPIANQIGYPIEGLVMDDHRATVTIEQNVADLDLSSLANAQNKLNDAALWGCAARTIKFMCPSWQRLVYGSCSFYYTRRLEFEIKFDGWDEEDIAQTSWYVVKGKWDTDGAGKKYWKVDTAGTAGSKETGNHQLYKDSAGENTPKRVFIDDNGFPIAEAIPANVKYHDAIELYKQTNFLQFDIPSSL